jgi:hypothetical protein
MFYSADIWLLQKKYHEENKNIVTVYATAYVEINSFKYKNINYY